ncbi:calcium/sodium antiporter [Ilumatobacter nonamiensis]|uniref:calcium/sodium antiporter n=1 Tax=Ilumatobacter nonamiensis TaxID=467093 RepID=UPI00034C576D|nr:calcium/sodium antiporter [Ilumatobacter nonamiensis]
MVIASLTLLGGLIGLVATGAAIVHGASRIGLRLGLPPLVVGLTIVAAGTSAPELAVTWLAAAEGDPSLALGNVVGSNIANILLVLGLVAVIGVIPISRRARTIEFPFMIGASILTAALALDGHISRTDGFILVAILVVYLVWVVRDARRPGSSAATDEIAMEMPDGRQTLLAIGTFIVGAVGVAVSAQFVVNGAEDIALELGVPDLVVGLTVLAIGTSAPEVVTSVIAAIRGEREVAVGNAIGSNVFNLLFVLGVVSATQTDLPVADELIRLDFPVMIAVALLCIPFAITGAGITRWEGIAFLALYAAYLTYLVLDATESGAAAAFGITTLVVAVPTIAAGAVFELRRDRTRGP